MKEMKRIVILPIYNEEKMVVKILEELIDYADIFVIINDGSTDSSRKKIDQWIQGRDDVYFISLEKNKGLAAALKAGFCCVMELLKKNKIREGDIIITIDGDGQHRPEYINNIIDYMERNSFDMVLTQRDFSVYPRYKKLGNRGLSLLASILSGFKYKDIESGFRLMKVRVVTDLLRYYTGYKYSCAQEIGIITALSGYKVSNDYSVKIEYYRSNTTIIDLFINVIFGMIVFLKVKLNFKRALGVRSLYKCEAIMKERISLIKSLDIKGG